MKKYVEIKYSQFKSLMDEMRFKEIVVEGAHEQIWSFVVGGAAPYEIRVYSSVSIHTGVTRSNGKDAIRCVLFDSVRNKPVLSKIVHRTSGALERTRSRCREMWTRLKNNRCSCGGVLVARTSKTGHGFLGCSNYPDCINTKNFPKQPQSQLKLKV